MHSWEWQALANNEPKCHNKDQYGCQNGAFFLNGADFRQPLGVLARISSSAAYLSKQARAKEWFSCSNSIGNGALFLAEPNHATWGRVPIKLSSELQPFSVNLAG
jgi:hypothetical protein